MAISGDFVNITMTGRFKTNIIDHASTVIFVDCDNGSYSFFGTTDFCKYMKVTQNINGTVQSSCPPIKGNATLTTELYIEHWMPAVSFGAFLLPLLLWLNITTGQLVCDC